MKKIICLIFISILFYSCKEDKIEFVQSKVMNNKFLLKDAPSKDSLIKNLIKDFLLKNPSKYKNNRSTIFYKYTADTKYFIDHLPDPGGFSSYELEDVENQRLAVFDISKCETDTTKLIGEFYYYGINYNLLQIDTLIYKCN